MSEWRYRCPNGHCSWTPLSDGSYRCEHCGYFEKLTDMKTGASTSRTGGIR
jgi:hypothetical protein